MTDGIRDLRVLQVIAPAPFGGAESVARALSREYPGRAHLVALLQYGGEHPFFEQAKAEGLPVSKVTAGRRRYDLEIRALRELIETHRPDVVHTHVYHADFVGYRAARAARIPVVASVHGITGGDRKDRLYQWLDLKLLRRFDGLICVSESVRDKILKAGCLPERVHLVANPYSAQSLLTRAEAREVLDLPPNVPVVGWIGRVSIEKGADLFIRALAGLPRPHPLGVIIGTGPEIERARGIVRDLGVEDTVRFAGERPNAGGLLSAFDALVLSSRTEGLPMVLLEAMGARVPIVAFAVGGIPDAVDERSAWLAPPGNIAGLSDALSNALLRKEEAVQRSDAGEQIVRQRYGAQKWAHRMAEIHRTVIRRGQSARPPLAEQSLGKGHIEGKNDG
jgi:glycosyltransferase involved in cell wall biosynthesis